MKTGTILWACFTLAPPLAAQGVSSDSVQKLLPPDAKIVETAEVRLTTGAKRALALWVRHPERVVTKWDSCDTFLYGDHWFGPTSLSLVDTEKHALVNTIEIHSPNEQPEDKGAFPVPFYVKDFSSYFVPHPDKDQAGKPTILNLRDLTGEGVEGQFALFEYAACAIAVTSVFGYSPKSDTAVQYSVEVIEGRFKPLAQSWVYQVFATKPTRPGYWDFTWEAGHGYDAWIHEAVRFDPARQLFVDRRTIRPYPGLAQTDCSLQVKDLPKLFLGIQRIAPNSGESNIHDVQDLVDRTPPNEATATMTVVNYHGKDVIVDVRWQKDGAGGIGIRFMTASNLAAAVRTQLGNWCGAK